MNYNNIIQILINNIKCDYLLIYKKQVMNYELRGGEGEMQHRIILRYIK